MSMTYEGTLPVSGGRNQKCAKNKNFSNVLYQYITLKYKRKINMLIQTQGKKKEKTNYLRQIHTFTASNWHFQGSTLFISTADVINAAQQLGARIYELIMAVEHWGSMEMYKTTNERLYQMSLVLIRKVRLFERFIFIFNIRG